MQQVWSLNKSIVIPPVAGMCFSKQLHSSFPSPAIPHITKGCDGEKGLLSLEGFTDPESASVLDASAPAAASDPAASAPARAASAGCNTKVIPVGSYSHSSYTCVQQSAAQPAQVLCATAWTICWLTGETR